jgi:hypothetical protein
MFMEDTLFSDLNGRKTVSVGEVAKALNCDTNTIRRAAISGAIPGGFKIKVEGDWRSRPQWRFRVSVLEEWWAKQGLPKTEERRFNGK